MTTAKASPLVAVYVDCPGMSDPRAHMMRDHCSTCAPYWERIPTCPVDGVKLRERTQMPAGEWKPETKGYCRTCKKHYLLQDKALEPESSGQKGG